MRVLWLIGLLFFFGFIISANAATITQHAIQIDVDNTGLATVTEKFVFFFGSEQELEQFRNQAQRIGADLDAWRSFDSQITNYIGNIRPGTASIGFEEKEGDRQVRLTYQTQEPLFSKIETPRQTDYSIDSQAFESFRRGSIYVIPGNTKIVFSLPRQANLKIETLKPPLEDPLAIEQARNEKRIFWSGHLSVSGQLAMDFSVEKQIAPTVSLSQLFKTMVENGDASIIGAVILIVLGFAYFKRKSIQKKMEVYLVKNSQLEPRKESEELELEENQ